MADAGTSNWRNAGTQHSAARVASAAGSPYVPYCVAQNGEPGLRDREIAAAIPLLSEAWLMLASRIVAITEELRAASARAEALCARMATARLQERPGPEKWSVGECIAHLRLTSEVNFPLWQEALRIARQEGVHGAEPFRVDLAGRLLAWGLEPPAKFRIRTSPPFQPIDTGPAEQVLPAFLASQDRILAIIDGAKDLPLDRIKMTSPFNAYVRYSVWSSFVITTAHERRHLWQADRVRQTILGD
jgi:DinB superfamily